MQEWWFNPSVHRAKGDRLVCARVLPVCYNVEVGDIFFPFLQKSMLSDVGIHWKQLSEIFFFFQEKSVEKMVKLTRNVLLSVRNLPSIKLIKSK